MAIQTFPANAEMRSIMLCAHQSFENAVTKTMTSAKEAGDRKMRSSCDVGIISLATMGSNLALNIADKGFEVAVFNRTWTVTESFVGKHASYMNIHGFQAMEAFRRRTQEASTCVDPRQGGRTHRRDDHCVAEVLRNWRHHRRHGECSLQGSDQAR